MILPREVEVSLELIVAAAVDCDSPEDVAVCPVRPEQDHRNALNRSLEGLRAKDASLEDAVPDSALHVKCRLLLVHVFRPGEATEAVRSGPSDGNWQCSSLPGLHS